MRPFLQIEQLHTQVSCRLLFFFFFLMYLKVYLKKNVKKKQLEITFLGQDFWCPWRIFSNPYCVFIFLELNNLNFFLCINTFLINAVSFLAVILWTTALSFLHFCHWTRNNGGFYWSVLYIFLVNFNISETGLYFPNQWHLTVAFSQVTWLSLP